MASRRCLLLLVLALLCVVSFGAEAPPSAPPSQPPPGSSSESPELGGLPEHRGSQRVQVQPQPHDAAQEMSGRRFGGHRTGDRSFLGGCVVLAGLGIAAAVVIFCYIRVTRTPNPCCSEK